MPAANVAAWKEKGRRVQPSWSAGGSNQAVSLPHLSEADTQHASPPVCRDARLLCGQNILRARKPSPDIRAIMMTRIATFRRACLVVTGSMEPKLLEFSTG